MLYIFSPFGLLHSEIFNLFIYFCLSNSIQIVQLFKILNMYTIKFAKFNLINKINPFRKRLF